MVDRRRFPAVPVLLISAALLFALYQIHRILIPFALGFAMAYVLNPIVSAFELRGLRRWVIVLMMFLFAAGALGFAAGSLTDLVTTQFSSLQVMAPSYLVKSKTLIAGYERDLIRRLPYGYGAIVSKAIDQRLTGPLVDQLENVPTYVLGLFPILSFLLLIPLVTFYMLLDGPDAIDRFIQACPSRYVEQALHLISEIDASLGSYLRGIIIDAFAITAAAFVGLLVLDVNQALAISILAGVCNFIPYIGALLAGLAGGLVALFQYGNIWAFLRVAALFCAIRFLDDWVLQPLIAKQTVHLHALAYLLTLLIGGEFFGLAGLIFAVPVVCILKALITVVWAWYSTETQLRQPAMLDAAMMPYT